MANDKSIYGYRTPHKNVLLVGCIDLRFADDVCIFMDSENLTNRYDHFALAGAALGGILEDVQPDLAKCICSNGKKIGQPSDYFGWQKTLFQHLDLAILLHKVQDVYIIEHEDCGAYKAFLKDGDFSHDDDTRREHKAHKHYAKVLAKKIQAHVLKADPHYEMNVHSFIMDLKGGVHFLETFPSKHKHRHEECNCDD